MSDYRIYSEKPSESQNAHSTIPSVNSYNTDTPLRFYNRSIINSMTGRKQRSLLSPANSAVCFRQDKRNRPFLACGYGMCRRRPSDRLVLRHVEHSNQPSHLLAGTRSKSSADTYIYTHTYRHVHTIWTRRPPPSPYPDYTASLSFAQRPEEQLSYLEARVRTVLLCHASPMTYPPDGASLCLSPGSSSHIPRDISIPNATKSLTFRD